MRVLGYCLATLLQVGVIVNAAFYGYNPEGYSLIVAVFASIGSSYLFWVLGQTS